MKRSIYFCKPWFAASRETISETPRLSVQSCAHAVHSALFRKIRPALYIWVAFQGWVSLFKPLYRMFFIA